MSNYIPHYTKKKKLLARKERDLERLIARSEPLVKLLAVAEEVRDARVRVLQARRATIAPKANADIQFKKLDLQFEQLLKTLPESILLEFGYSVADEGE